MPSSVLDAVGGTQEAAGVVPPMEPGETRPDWPWLSGTLGNLWVSSHACNKQRVNLRLHMQTAW